MKFFDVHARTDTRSDDDLKNLAYFDTEAVVTTAHDYRPFEHADDMLEYFEWLCTEEYERIERCGLDAHVALGVLPHARPERSHPELWPKLPAMLDEDRVVAVGEVGAWRDEEAHWELFERQVRMAKETGVAVLATPPDDLRANMTYKMMLRAEEVGIEPQRVVMNYLDDRLVEKVVRDGFIAGVAVGPSTLEAQQAAETIAETVDRLGSAERIVLSSALRDRSSDVLALPKTVSALLETSLDEEQVRKIARENARKLFGCDG